MFKTINNEKGVAMIAALMILAMLTILGIASILTSTTDVQISSNEKIATQQQYAAEAGIAQALVMLNLSTTAGKVTEPDPAITWDTRDGAAYLNWVRPVKAVMMDGANTYSTFSATISYKRKGGGLEVAFYNTSSGFSDAPSSSGGWPVYEIRSVARQGGYRTQAHILEVTRKSYTFNVDGGFSAGGAVELKGTPNIDGRHYAYDAEPGDASLPTGTGCKSPELAKGMPAVFANGSTIAKGAVDFDNSSGQDAIDASDMPAGAVPDTPWEALGLGDQEDMPGTDEDFHSLFPSGPQEFTSGKSLDGDQYYKDVDPDFSNEDISGAGLLILHNPDFVPGECKKGVWDGAPDVPDGGANDCLASKAPATLDANTGTYRGLIIADSVSLRGNVTIIGSLISLSTVKIEATGAGSPTIMYSCQAIEKYAGGQINKKLNWHKE